MSHESTLFLLGVLVLLSPFLGLPYSWLMVIVPALGLSIAALSVILRARGMQDPALRSDTVTPPSNESSSVTI